MGEKEAQGQQTRQPGSKVPILVPVATVKWGKNCRFPPYRVLALKPRAPAFSLSWHPQMTTKILRRDFSSFTLDGSGGVSCRHCFL